MRKSIRYGILFLMLYWTTDSSAQVAESPIKIFGYFQTQFNQNDGNVFANQQTNSFLLQQLNLFLQKDLAEDFAALIDIEILNTLSTSEATGALNLQEAWVRYRAGRDLNIKVGLQLPIFNHLNTIKNRTPVLPYVIRPLVYEESFDQLASIEEYIPSRAFFQAYGSLLPGALKVDYALMLGNSPNERTNDDRGQSGVDTTNTVLIGGRIGLRVETLKIGVSVTHEKVNRFLFLADRSEIQRADLIGIPRIRLGMDLRYTLGPLTLEAEFIDVNYKEEIATLNVGKTFYYGTLSWLIKDRLTLYTSYWVTRENRVQLLPGTPEDEIPPDGVPAFVSTNKAPSIGVAFDLRDRVVLKGQFTHISRSTDNALLRPGPSINTYSLGVSVFF